MQSLPVMPVSNAGAGGMAGVAMLDAGNMQTAAGAGANDDRDAGPVVTETVAGSGGAAMMQAGSGGVNAGAGGMYATSTCPSDFDPASLPKRTTLSGDLAASDPALIERDGAYYLFSSGPGIAIKHSTDMKAWQSAGRVFAANPNWIAQRVPGASDLWAPDISRFGGSYHLYYAASKEGGNRSCIGHATSDDLKGFTDHGPVICSNPNDDGADDWNAIDPNVAIDAGKPFLVLGSFYSGLKLIALDEHGARLGEDMIALAKRPDAGGAIEAPFLIRRCDHFYLFASFDRCCDGAASTYNIRVGRAPSVTGPYLDREGKSMLQGGGTLLVKGDDAWHGPGHNAIIATGDHMYEVHHAYYAGASDWTFTNGASYLRISQLVWDTDGWPVSGGP